MQLIHSYIDVNREQSNAAIKIYILLVKYMMFIFSVFFGGFLFVFSRFFLYVKREQITVVIKTRLLFLTCKVHEVYFVDIYLFVKNYAKREHFIVAIKS